tara:strand:+ start:11229 stop:11579 length:351 start_codon:yes stop_codon:yes gene_type:complete
MRQYPIWCVVDAPNYNSSKSYGTREYTTTDVKIGTSRVNSFDFVKTEIKKTVIKKTFYDSNKVWDAELYKFEFLVDDVVVKIAYYNPKNQRLEVVQDQNKIFHAHYDEENAMNNVA